ncbi:MAG: metal-dependent hydrolase [Anaerolineaceae bacterium]|nr:metal-dependent hydrolase [Anaerolineaceae bacterium]
MASSKLNGLIHKSMPSPIAHAAMGYAIYRVVASKKPEKKQPRIGRFPRLLIYTLAVSQLPDLDFVPGFLLPGEFDQFHNTITNSLIVGLGIALMIGLGARIWQRNDFWFMFMVALVCYQTHVIMDFFTVGRGVMLFWPLTPERFEPMFKLFYGLHRSDGWLSIRHIWTLVTELGFVLFLNLVVHTAVSRQALH